MAAIYDARNKPAPVSLAPASAVPSGPARSPAACRLAAAVFAGHERGSRRHPSLARAAAGAADRQRLPRTQQPQRLLRAGTTTAAAAPAAAPGRRRDRRCRDQAQVSTTNPGWRSRTGPGAVIFSRLNPAGAEQVGERRAAAGSGDRQCPAVRLTYRDQARRPRARTRAWTSRACDWSRWHVDAASGPASSTRQVVIGGVAVGGDGADRRAVHDQHGHRRRGGHRAVKWRSWLGPARRLVRITVNSPEAAAQVAAFARRLDAHGRACPAGR